MAEGGKASLAGKRVLMVIAAQRFRDEEYREPRAVIESHGGRVTVASTSLEESEGMLGMVVKPDVTLDRVDIRDYDAVIFVGGSGASQYWDDRAAHEMARQAEASGKVVGAICIAPVTLANAGLLKGRRATVWPQERARLEAGGATYTGNPVEEDGRIITAAGPQAAHAFGEAVARAIARAEAAVS